MFWIVRIALPLALAICAGSSHSQEVKQVAGTVYSYVDANNVRHYTSTPPPPGAHDVRTIGYTFREKTAQPPA